MNKIFKSLSVIAFVGAVALSLTAAYYSDTKTSEGNTFTAGEIELKIDNHSWYNGVYQAGMSWEYNDGMGLFFDFPDLKPGDWGEDTISIHVYDNDAWACMDFNLYNADDNGLTDPEENDGDTTDGAGRGELQNEIHFVWWHDDGDNVLEKGEEIFEQMISLGNLNGFSVPLADSSGNGVISSTALIGSHDYYIGKAWCFGEFNLMPEEQDNETTHGPGERNAGLTCDGGPVNNVTQSDSVQGTLSFRAVQSRNNDDFVCESPCSNVSFVYDSELPGFEGVDPDTSSWSTDGSTVNLGTNTWPLLGGSATVDGYLGGNAYNLTHRGVRGLGVAGGENDEVDDPEKIEIVFDELVLVNEFEVRSLFTGENGDEEGDVELYNGANLIQSYHLTAAEAGGNGVLSTIGTNQPVDKIVFYVAPNQTYTSFSEFAVGKIRVCPVN